MNENPEGTPNPLNPTPAAPEAPAAPAEPATPASAEPVAPAEPVASVEPAAPAGPATPAAPESTAPAQEQSGSVVKPAKKTGRKVGLIIGIIVGILALGGGTAAALMLTVFKPNDAVPAAIEKLLSGEKSKYYEVTGNISGNPSSSYGVSALNINFKADIDTVAPSNYVTATVAANIMDTIDVSLNLEETQVAGGDVFVKVDGLSDSLSGFISDEDSAAELGAFSMLEGDWLRVDLNNSSSEQKGINILDNRSSCLVNALSNVSSYSNSLAEIYKQNQFVTYSTDNIKLDKKKDTLYRLGYNSTKFADFINAMGNSGFVNDLLACTGGTATKVDVTASQVEEIFKYFPDLYVEIDGNANITRAYFDATEYGFTADLSISYPNTLNINEPSSYKDVNDYMGDLLEMFSNGSSAFDISSLFLQNQYNTKPYYDYDDDYDYDFDYDYDEDYDYDFDLDELKSSLEKLDL